MSSLKPHDLSPVFNDRTLHSEADAEERYTSLSCKANGLNFPFDSPLAETAWYWGQMGRMAQGLDPDPAMSVAGITAKNFFGDTWRALTRPKG